MKRLAFLIPVLVFPFTSSCGQANSKSYQLKGLVSRHTSSWLFIEQVQGTAVIKIDSAKTDGKGAFAFTKKVPVKDFYRLRTGNNNLVGIILDPAEQVTYTNEGISLQEKYTLEGSKEGDIVLAIKSVKQRTAQYGDSLNNLLAGAPQESQAALLPGLQQDYFRFMAAQQEKIRSMASQYSGSLALVTLAEQVDPDQDFPTYEKIASDLAKNYPNSAFARQIADRAAQLKKTAIGQPAPEIELPSPAGNNIALSSLRGKVVLIDFWASWCGPCRKENPNVVNMYNRFKDKGFDIYSVSLDKDKASWERAITQDQLAWPSHVSDLGYWSSSVVPQYGFQGIPFTVLLDKEGKIVAKGLRGPQLEEKVAELLR